MDPTGHDALSYWLAFGHPALMVVAIVLCGLGLRAGLGMRRRRTRGEPPKKSLLVSHLRMVRPGVLLMLVGLVGGPASAVWLRGWEPFGTFHSLLGVLAAAMFVATGFLGLRLQRGQLRREDGANTHGLIGTLGMLVAALAAAAGMVLLP